jgi:hypothetical protein
VVEIAGTEHQDPAQAGYLEPILTSGLCTRYS